MLCTANQKDVFPPTQPITQCDAHATWFDARKRMLASSSMVMTTFVICMAMIGATWLQTRQQDNLVELSDLYVSSRDSDQSFSGWAQDKRTLTWVPYSADICPTMTLTDEVQPGVIIAWTGYRPDYVHHCWDISGGRDFGITLYRHKGAHHDPIITPDPRQTTGASLWSPAPTP